MGKGRAAAASSSGASAGMEEENTELQDLGTFLD